MSYFASSHANHETGRGFKLSLSAPKSENEEDSLSPVDRVDGKMTWDEVVKKKKIKNQTYLLKWRSSQAVSFSKPENSFYFYKIILIFFFSCLTFKC